MCSTTIPRKNNNKSKFQRTEEFTRKVCMLLYYVHRTTFNKINWKFLPIIIIHFYRLIWFNIWRCFLWQTIYQVFQFRSPWFKIYRCMLLQSTKYFKILNNPTILHTKKFLSQPVTCAIKYHLIQNFHILHWYTHSIIIQHRLFRNTIQTKILFKHFPFSFFRIRVKVTVTVQSATRTQ